MAAGAPGAGIGRAADVVAVGGVAVAFGAALTVGAAAGGAATPAAGDWAYAAPILVTVRTNVKSLTLDIN